MLRHNAKIELIKRAPLFSRCSSAELRKVASLADEVALPEGKDLTREGDTGREFFVFTEGTADVRRKGRKIGTMKAGDFFGEIALVSARPRTATVTTTSPARALVLEESAFRALLLEAPSIRDKVLAAICDRLPPDEV